MSNTTVESVSFNETEINFASVVLKSWTIDPFTDKSYELSSDIYFILDLTDLVQVDEHEKHTCAVVYVYRTERGTYGEY